MTDELYNLSYMQGFTVGHEKGKNETVDRLEVVIEQLTVEVNTLRRVVINAQQDLENVVYDLRSA